MILSKKETDNLKTTKKNGPSRHYDENESKWYEKKVFLIS